MRGAEHRLLDGDAGLVRAEQHGAARPHIPRIRQDALVVPLEPPPGVAREEIGDFGAPQRDERLHGVRDGVEAGDGRHHPGLGHGERWIENRHPERCFRITARHLRMRFVVRDQGVRLCFASVPAVVGTPSDGSIGRAAFPKPR